MTRRRARPTGGHDAGARPFEGEPPSPGSPFDASILQGSLGDLLRELDGLDRARAQATARAAAADDTEPAYQAAMRVLRDAIWELPTQGQLMLEIDVVLNRRLAAHPVVSRLAAPDRDWFAVAVHRALAALLFAPWLSEPHTRALRNAWARGTPGSTGDAFAK